MFTEPVALVYEEREGVKEKRKEEKREEERERGGKKTKEGGRKRGRNIFSGGLELNKTFPGDHGLGKPMFILHFSPSF